MADPAQLVAAAAYGVSETVSPLVRRVLACNPSPFTYTGTGTYIVGRGEVAVIDPGPDDADHVAAVLAAVAGETVRALLVTHTHMDHSPAAPALKAATGAPIIGCAPLALSDDGPRADAGFDPAYAPDRVLAEGEAASGPGWTLRALATPGHTSNHLCFALEEEQALFTGDHVMGWSTTVVAPPDGDMAAYIASLKRLLDRDDRVYYPTHGAPVTDPQRFVRGLVTHRKQRETQILALLEGGPKPIPDMVAAMYAQVDKRLHPAAGRSVLAHLIDLRARGVVAAEGETWRLAAWRRALLLGALAGLVLGGLLVLLLREPLARLLGGGPDPTSIAGASLRAVQAQNRLTAFAARFTVAVTSEQSRLGGVFTARKTLIVPGTVRYELDWDRVAARDLTWDAATRTLSVRIPTPVIAGPEIDLTRIREFKDGTLLFALTDAEGELDAANRARVQQALLAEAQAPMLLAMARDATAKAVERTFALPLAAAGVEARVAVRVG